MAILPAALALIASVLANADPGPPTGRISGRVLDIQGAPVAGARVGVSGAQPALQAVTDPLGRYALAPLLPGTYALRIERAGLARAELRDLPVTAGVTTTAPDVRLAPASRTESVEVHTIAPAAGAGVGAVTTVIDHERLEQLPLGRNVANAFYLVPGVSSGGGTGLSEPSISGTGGLENRYEVDGLNVTNVGWGGLGSYRGFETGLGLPVDMIGELRVTTAGFDATEGMAAGGVVRLAIPSGGRHHHGSLFAFAQPAALSAGWRELQSPGGTVNTRAVNELDGGFSLGGPVLRDRLWYFAALAPQERRRAFAAPEGFPLETLGAVERRRRVWPYALKLAWQAAARHRLEMTAFGDHGRSANGPQSLDALTFQSTSGFVARDAGAHSQVLRYQGSLAPWWQVQAMAGAARSLVHDHPATDEWRVTDRTRQPIVSSGGVGRYVGEERGRNLQYTARSSFAFRAAGAHELLLGAAYEDVDYSNDILNTGPPIRLADGRMTETGAIVNVMADPVYGRIYRANARLTGRRATEQRYAAAFLEDTWRVGRWTLRPGLRYDDEVLLGNGRGCRTDAPEAIPAAAGEPTGLCRLSLDANWAPRLGVAFDIAPARRARAFAAYARLYDRIPNDLAMTAFSSDVNVGPADYFDPALTQPVPDGVLALGTRTHLRFNDGRVTAVDPAARPTSVHEAVLGLDVGAGAFTLGGRYIRRRLVTVLEDARPAAVVLFDLEVAGVLPGPLTPDETTLVITNPRRGFPSTARGIGSFEDPVRDYDALEVVANRPLAAGWSLFASYRWSRLRGSYEGFFNNESWMGGFHPVLSILFDFPTDDPSYTQVGGPDFGYRGDIRLLGCTMGCGPLAGDRPHQLRAYGTLERGRWQLALSFAAESGIPLTPMAAHPVDALPGEIPEAPRGSGFATADGFRRRTPPQVSVDLRAAYGVPAGRGRVTISADVFNVLDRQQPLAYDHCTEVFTREPNPNFGSAALGCVSRAPSYASPRQVRLGARFDW